MFDLSEKSRGIRNAAVAFAAEKIVGDMSGGGRSKPTAIEVMREAASRGLAGTGLTEATGGAGLASLDAVLVFEALAQRSPAMAADVSIHNLVARLIDRHGSPPQRGAWLPKLASMAWVAGLCQGEPEPGGDAAVLALHARRDGDHYVVDGKQLSWGAPSQNVCVAMVSSGGEGQRAVSALLVEAGLPGLTFGDNERNSRAEMRRATALRFHGCRVPVANRIGAEGDGLATVATVLDGARLNIAACSLGGAEAALKEVLGWLSEHVTDKRRLDETQAAQFRIAEMAIELEAARTFLWRAACALENGEPNPSLPCAMAKRFAGDVSLKVANAALALRDVYGRDTGLDLEEITRDLRAYQILHGTSDTMRTAIAQGLLGVPQ